MKSKVLLLHGSFNGPSEKWLSWVKAELETKGYEVYFPILPTVSFEEVTEKGKLFVENVQSKDIWLNQLRKDLPSTDGGWIVVGHSTGPIFSLHAISKLGLNVEKAIWVAPFMEYLDKTWQVDLVNSSFVDLSSLDLNNVDEHIDKSYVIYSDDDPYVDMELSRNFAEMFNAEEILVKGGKHMNNSAGFETFQLVLDIILDK